MAAQGRLLVTVVAVMLLAACGAEGNEDTRPSSSPPQASPTPTHEAPAVLMPDLVGLPSAEALALVGEIEGSSKLGVSSSWTSTFVRCGARPGTVVSQEPAPGTPLERDAVVHLREASLDLNSFRGPCEPTDGDLGPVTGPDAALARQFYRFSANPALGAPFAVGEVWVGIENGLSATTIGESDWNDLAAWELDAAYAEASGPFSALDIAARSGGYYELHRGVPSTCFGNDQTPPELMGLRAISLTAPLDTVSACMQWWGVTLFLDDENQIRGVALRLGSP